MRVVPVCVAALVCALLSRARAAPAMNLTLVAGSHCLDGSPAGFYHSAAQSPRGRLRWVLYLEGGGLCFTKADCEERTLTSLGSSKFFAASRQGSGVQAVDPARNPDFWDANHIFVPYWCVAPPSTIHGCLRVVCTRRERVGEHEQCMRSGCRFSTIASCFPLRPAATDASGRHPTTPADAPMLRGGLMHATSPALATSTRGPT